MQLSVFQLLTSNLMLSRLVTALKIVLPALGVLLSFDIGFSIGETRIKTYYEVYYNWAVLPKRIGASIAFSLILGAIGYTTALVVESAAEAIKLRINF